MLNDPPLNNPINIDQLSVAERHYLNHLKAVKKYYHNNKDKLNNNNIINYHNIKNNNDELYNQILEQKKIIYENNKEHILSNKKNYYQSNIDQIKEKKKIYYQNVVKPKNQLLKKLNKSINHDFLPDLIIDNI